MTVKPSCVLTFPVSLTNFVPRFGFLHLDLPVFLETFCKYPYLAPVIITWWMYVKVALKTEFSYNMCIWIIVSIILSSPVSQICGVSLRGISSGQLCAVLCSRWSVDAECSPGGHVGYCGYRPPKAWADWLLPASGRQHPAGSQRGIGLVDGHSAVATAVNCSDKTKTKWLKHCVYWEMFSQDVFGTCGPLNCDHTRNRLHYPAVLPNLWRLMSRTLLCLSISSGSAGKTNWLLPPCCRPIHKSTYTTK